MYASIWLLALALGVVAVRGWSHVRLRQPLGQRKLGGHRARRQTQRGCTSVHCPVMRVGKGNGKRSGGMNTGNSIMRENQRRRAELKDPSKIFIGNLAWNTTKDELTSVCKSHGDVAHVKIVRDHFTQKSKVSQSAPTPTGTKNVVAHYPSPYYNIF